MESLAALAITYEPPGQAPVSVVVVRDQALLRHAARLALECAEREAEAAAVDDPVMGRMLDAESRRLRTALEILVPGFAKEEAVQ